MFPQDRDGYANYLKPLSTKHRHNIWHMDADGSLVVNPIVTGFTLPTKATDKRQCGPLKALHQCLILGAKFALLEKKLPARGGLGSSQQAPIGIIRV